MKLKFTTFSDMKLSPKYRGYEVEVEIDGVSASEMLENLDESSINELAKAIEPEVYIQQHGADSLLETIGEEQIKEYLIEQGYTVEL